MDKKILIAAAIRQIADGLNLLANVYDPTLKGVETITEEQINKDPSDA